MAVTINASTSSGLQITSDTSGAIAFQTNGTQYNPTLVSATAQASTSGTSIDFTSIPSWVKRITVMFSGVSTNGTSPLAVQVGSGSIATSGYNSAATTVSTATSSTTSGSGATNITDRFVIATAATAASFFYGHFVLTKIDGNTWVASGTGYIDGADRVSQCAGNVVLSGGLDQVRITTVNGTDTFDAGTINIMYE